MRLIDKTPLAKPSAVNSPELSRRSFLATSGAAVTLLISGSAIMCPVEAWGYEVKSLKPETMKALIKLARDVYPHERIGERFYAIAMKGYDTDTQKASSEEFVAKLDKTSKEFYGSTYAEQGWEVKRVDVLREYQKHPFFQKVRGGLVTGLYNQPEVWPLFGYEGESASKGGYVDRGFGDIDWL